MVNLRLALYIVVVGILGVLLLVVYHPAAERSDGIARYVEAHAREDTGAVNLVSSIYLGYRILDTLGETIVLLVTVSGIIAVLERRQ